MVVHILNMYVVGSIIGTYFALHCVNSWDACSFLSSFCRDNEIFERNKASKWQFWNKSLGSIIGMHVPQKYETNCVPIINPSPAQLLTQLFALPKKVCPKLAQAPIFILFLETHTYKPQKIEKQKHHNFHIWKHNCPLEFWPEVVPLFGPPFFWIVIVPSLLLT